MQDTNKDRTDFEGGLKGMAIYQTGGYQVKPSAVGKVKKAIEEFVRYVQANEPSTHMYLAWQKKDDPTRFLHLFIFEDAAAQARHGQSGLSNASNQFTHRS
jgi:quinol monooxygenase YgiN